MADEKITELAADTSPTKDDLLVTVNAPGGTPATKKSTIENFLKVINDLTADATPDTAADYLISYDASASSVKKVLMNLVGGSGGVTSGPEAFGDNYVITPSISSNNLTVALKTIAGADPSAGDKITFRIGNVKYDFTAATSLTINAGASGMNIGSSELKTLKVNVFVYAVRKAADGSLGILISRLCHGKTVADFNATATNEKGYYSSVASLASTDLVENIGRFDLANSGTASFNWSLPTGATVINRPIFETDELTWVPTWSCSGSLTFGSVSNVIQAYKIKGNTLFYQCRGSGTLGGTGSPEVRFTVPMLPRDTGAYAHGWALLNKGGTMFGGSYITSSVMASIGYDNSNWPTTGTGIVDSNGQYFI